MDQSGYPALYGNPIIKSGMYLAKVLRVRASPREDGATTLNIELLIDHHGSELDGTKLVAIVHSNQKAKPFFDAFLQAYRVTEKTVQEAVGRYAAIWVYDAQYGGSFYSAVRFPLQTFAIQEKVTEIEAEEAAAKAARKRTRPQPKPPEAPPTGFIDWNAA
ncbi:MAG: hypothetical protein K2Y21_12495 [Phycisphaerales bacterium]|nr:hypothetical protein [Phycisphaerales bacterium]